MSRRDYGAAVQAPAAILRFALPKASFWQRLRGHGLGGYASGDLLGIIPEGSKVPRFYSLASSRRDRFIEICVRKHAGGLCSNQLLALAQGDAVAGFVRRNPDFRPASERSPVILVGAGTGIGPLAGFIRANRTGRPMQLYFGARHKDIDFFYDTDISEWQTEGRLTDLVTAFSRTPEQAYVQDALRANAAQVTRDIAAGGQVLVCGGRDMARGVYETLTDILAPKGLSPALLKAEGRFGEDIY